MASHNSWVRVANRFLEHLRALGLGLGLRPRLGVLAQRLDGDDAEEDGADPDEDAEPAEIIGKPVGLGREEQALLDLAAKRLALAGDDFVQLLIETKLFPVPGRLEIISDPGLALAGDGGSRRKRQPSAMGLIGRLQLVDAPDLVLVLPNEAAQLLDLVAGDFPIVGVDGAAALGRVVFVENEPRERGFRARHAGADVADDQGDVVAVPLCRQRLFARVVGAANEEHQSEQDQRGDQADGRGTAPAPVEPYLFVVRDHGVSLTPSAGRRKPLDWVAVQLMTPVARPAAANMARISPTCSLECSAQSEQRSRVMPAGVAGGRARLT